MTSTRSCSRTRAGALLLALSVAALGACSSDGDDQDVASVAGTTTGSEDGSPATDAIGDFVACLVDGGVPAVVGGDGNIAFPESMSVSISNGTGGGGPLNMQIDGQDVSEAWATCEAKFPDVEPFPDPENLSPEEVAAQNEAGTEWATCAREAGFSDIADPQDGMVSLPTTMTAERAAALGQACPIDDFGSFGISSEDVPEDQAEGVFTGLFGEGAASTFELEE